MAATGIVAIVLTYIGTQIAKIEDAVIDHKKTQQQVQQQQIQYQKDLYQFKVNTAKDICQTQRICDSLQELLNPGFKVNSGPENLKEIIPDDSKGVLPDDSKEILPDGPKG